MQEPEKRAPSPQEPQPKLIVCDLCGYEVLALHCKLRCVQCGATRDCSDL
jgi:hypothetical protein